MRDATMKAWLEDLREFPAELVATACRDWRRTHSKRPHIADIRQGCIKLVQPHGGHLAAPTSAGFTRRPVTVAEAELRRQREQTFADAERARDEWARACGFDSFAEAWKSPIGLVSIGQRHPAYLARRQIEDIPPPAESTETSARACSDALEDVL